MNKFWALGIVLAGGLLTAGMSGTPAAAAPRPISVTITLVECVEAEECDAAGIEAAGQSWPDFYARVYIDGVPTDTPRAPDDQRRITPNWVITREVDDLGKASIPVTIQIWDHDSTSGDDIADASPARGRNNLDFSIDLATGLVSGDTTTNCATGDGVDTDDDDYYPVTVCFTVSTGDTDGDGLLDSWETSAVDVDGDGVIDLDLPAWGANPLRQDLFLELDYEIGREPTRAGISAIRHAFASSPHVNPDGSTGITLHVDTGNLVDVNADEADRVGTCSDGVDNDRNGLIDSLDPNCSLLGGGFEGAGNCGNGIDDDGDGLVDGLDPQCLVGDNLGGGTGLTIAVADRPCGYTHSPNYGRLKAANFNPQRQTVFRYAMQAQSTGATVCAGGQGEIGGNDFVSHRLDPGTLMHELGHNLNLDHGGSEDTNCKPNYVSVMNYRMQGGILRVAGGMVLDYSPPLLALGAPGRGAAPLATLVEDALSETTPIDPTDNANQTSFSNGALGMSTIALNANPDWSGGPGAPAAAGVNINSGVGGGPRECTDASTTDRLAGDDDWSRITVNLRAFGASAPGALVDNPEQLMTDEELQQMYAGARRTDLVLTLSEVPAQIIAGDRLALTATIANAGNNLAAGTHLDLAGTGVARLFPAPPAGCTVPSADLMSCDLGALNPGENRVLDLSTMVPANLVYDAGAPIQISATVTAGHHAGEDSNPDNNSATITSTVIAQSDLSVAALAALNPPTSIRIGEPVVIELASTLGSRGPSSPMDVTLTFTAEENDAVTITPSEAKTFQIAMLQAETRRISNHPILTCKRAGQHSLQFDQQIAPTREGDVDPANGNNMAGLSITVQCAAAETAPSHPTPPTDTGNSCEPVVPGDPAQPRSSAGLLNALDRAGVDYSVPEAELLSWLSVCPPSTAYPAMGQAILEQGWHFAAPVYLDVIVWNYESTAGSPREVADISTEALQAAILAASNERNGTSVGDFNALLRNP